MKVRPRSHQADILVIEASFDRRFNNLKIGRHVEITWGIEAVVADMQDFLTRICACRTFMVGDMINQRQNRILDRLEGLGDKC